MRRSTTPDHAAVPFSHRIGAPKLGLFMGSALASIALASCTASAPPAETSFAKAQGALAHGKTDHAIGHAETAVLAAPRDASYRALLGAAYLEAGRFEAAATSFAVAMELGDTNPRVVLSHALALTAMGDNRAALESLARYERAIPAADLGLAVALAGQPERGVHLLINSVRAGDGHAKARQNLAYAYALAGNWRAARVMAAEDVPAGEVDARMSQWATTIAPEAHRERVAGLLGVTTTAFGDAPAHLALSNFPTQEMLAAEARKMRADEVNADLAASDTQATPEVAQNLLSLPVESDPAPVMVVQAKSDASGGARLLEEIDPSFSLASTPAPKMEVTDKPSPVTASSAARAVPGATASSSAGATLKVASAATRFVSNAVVQDAPRSARAERSAPATTAAKAKPASQRRAAIAKGSAATHLIQLGSYDSRAIAQEKWNRFSAKFPQFQGREAVISEAVVNGRTYFRLAASGFGRRSASAMCATIKASGRGCFAYAASSPPAGEVKRTVQVAARGN